MLGGSQEKSDMKFALLIFTLNELEGMRQIMPQINRNWVDELLIVDGGSTDGTVEYSKENGYDVYCQRRKGLRHAYIEALQIVESDYIIAFSPDGNSMPEKIPELRRAAEQGYDMVICSRYLDEAKSYDDDFITAFGNWFFTKSINLIHGGNYTDALVMYRATNRQVFASLGLDRDHPFRLAEKLLRTTLCLVPLLSIRAARKRLRITEIPGDEPTRIGDERKLKIFRWGLAYYFQILSEAFFKY